MLVILLSWLTALFIGFGLFALSMELLSSLC
jgi:hypothetical protein